MPFGTTMPRAEARISPPNLDLIIRRWPTARAREWLTAFSGRAAYDPNVRAVVAVGSAIRSDVRSEDLDLIANCHDRSQLHERAPIEVDLRAYDLDRIEQALEDRDDLLAWSVRFGRAVRSDVDGQHILPVTDPLQNSSTAVRSWTA